MSVQTALLPDRYHNAMLAWQQREFVDYPLLLEHWSRFYRQEPFRLVAKIGTLRSPVQEVGRHKGEPKLDHAHDLDEEAMLQAARIIKAQASTELGSIQQHRESLRKGQDEKMQFDVLRVMAEELRHAYQMVYLLAADDWTGVSKDLAEETIDNLLTMTTGTHVLDAFNTYFDSFVDNIVFAAVIDRVGKYQLQMQKVFAYAPMARSMGPMLQEEAFHLVTGVGPLKQWASEAALDRGNISMATMQHHINKWFPRGLEMFGKESGGEVNVELGFKDMANGEAMEKYAAEVAEQVVDPINSFFLKARFPEMPPEQRVAMAHRILESGEPEEGIRPEDLITMPDVRFFRRRGDHAFELVGAGGETFSGPEAYASHLRRVLPEAYVAGREFASYLENLGRATRGEKVHEEKLPFYG